MEVPPRPLITPGVLPTAACALPLLQAAGPRPAPVLMAGDLPAAARGLQGAVTVAAALVHSAAGTWRDGLGPQVVSRARPSTGRAPHDQAD